MKRDHKDSCGGAAGGTVKGECSSMPSNGKAKMWEEEQQKQQQQRMDELLAALGYKVRASDMADVAQKLEQLEMVMGCAQEDGISHLASDTLQISIHEIN